MSNSMTVVVALLGGIGGALFTGVFQALSQTWADQRAKRHELDEWLREKRFTHLNKIITLCNEATSARTQPERDECSHAINDACWELRTVIPMSLYRQLSEFEDKVTSALKRELLDEQVALEVGSTMGKASAALMNVFSASNGWNLEPLRGDRKPHWWQRKGRKANKPSVV